MHEATEDLIFEPTIPADLAADISRAEEWAGEPFLHPGEDADHDISAGLCERGAGPFARRND